MKHLKENDRIRIEVYLNQGFSLRKIAKSLGVAPSTISREVNKSKKEIRANNFGISIKCKNRKNCDLLKGASILKRCSIDCPNYETETCSFLNKKNSSPVCNSCPNSNKCHLKKMKYQARIAEFKHINRISESRTPSRLTQEQFNYLNNLFTPLMKQGQSISVIYNNHKNEIMVSENTIRNYVNKGLFDVNILDTIRPRFTSKTSKKRRTIKNIDLLFGRTYEDYLNYINNHESLIVQLDTVVGKLIDKKKILTIHWPAFHFQIGILLNSLNPININKAINNLKNTIGDSLYKNLFQTILTDNGIEFSMLDEIERDSNGELLSNVFFCDPYCSSQKGSCERNHEFIRYILPKGKSFDNLNQSNVDLIFSHINSTPRKSLGFKTPYQVMFNIFGKKLLDDLNMIEINSDDVILKPSLINK